MTDNERARELLAASYEEEGFDDCGYAVRKGGEAGWLTQTIALRAIEAALRQPAAGVDAVVIEEASWLIEDNSGGFTLWAALVENSWPRYKQRRGRRRSELGELDQYLTPVRFVKDANEALRFARKEDAEAVIKLFDRFLLNPVATEHQWPALADKPAA